MRPRSVTAWSDRPATGGEKRRPGRMDVLRRWRFGMHARQSVTGDARDAAPAPAPQASERARIMLTRVSGRRVLTYRTLPLAGAGCVRVRHASTLISTVHMITRQSGWVQCIIKDHDLESKEVIWVQILFVHFPQNLTFFPVAQDLWSGP